MAVYSVSMQWITIITYITQLFTRVKPIYVQMYETGDIIHFKQLLHKMIFLSSMIGIPIALFGLFGSKYIMRLYGESYVDSYLVFTFMMLSAIFITLQSQFGAVLNLISLFYLLLHKGALGYSISYLISYVIHCILSWFLIRFMLASRSKGKA